MPKNSWFFPILPTLQSGGIGVLPTDTIYGIVGSAFMPKTVEHVYRLRKRNFKKPMIVLISDMHDVMRFGIALDARTKSILKKVWPGKVSVVLPVGARNGSRRKFRYLHRGTGTIAFRMPKPTSLRALLRATGPLVAPSANFEGKPPALTIREAKKYFKDDLAFYIDIGKMNSKPSTLIAIRRGKAVVLREGAVRIPKALK